MTDGGKARLVGMVCFLSVAFLFACDDYAPLGGDVTCGNGVVEMGETCDTGIAAGQTGACPTSCTPPDSCTTSTLQNGGTCVASCQNTPIAPCCGNGVVEPGETCDIGIAAGQPGACPTSCNDNNACTTDILTGAVATCNAVCTHQAVTACTNDDGCCPNGCTGANDNDCAKCGNGVVDPLETCDIAIAAGQPGACPTTCPDDGNPCTNDIVQNPGTCTAACVHPAITNCVSGDGCCPATCTYATDSDCPDCVDQTGTWISRVTTAGSITAPAPIGTLTKATIDVVQRIVTTTSGGYLNFQFQICSLSTTNSAVIPFSTDYSAAVLATFSATASQLDQCVQAGGAFTLPSFTINSGWGGPPPPTNNTCPAPPSNLSYPYPAGTLPTSCSGAIDSDGDGVYGISLHTHLFGGLINPWSFAGLTMNISLNNMVMTDANTITGTSSFPTTGYIFGSDSGEPGNLNVVPSSNAVPVTAIKLAGDVPCSTVLTHCTGAACVP
jgi:hypothetical protein